MKHPGEEKHMIASAIQLGGGVLDLFFGTLGAVCVWSVIGNVGGALITRCTMGMCPVSLVSWLTGFLGCLVIPIAAVEIAAGVAGLATKKEHVWAQRIATFVGMGGILAGSVTSAIGGGIAFFLLNHADVKAWESEEG